MTPDDIGRLVVAANPTLSPDARWVAYTVNSVDAKANTYRSRLWLAAVDAATPPQAATARTLRSLCRPWPGRPCLPSIGLLALRPCSPNKP